MGLELDEMRFTYCCILNRVVWLCETYEERWRATQERSMTVSVNLQACSGLAMVNCSLG